MLAAYLAYELNCSHSTACRALKELDDAGLARPQTVGVWRGKRATEWRLTFYRCDATGDLPNKTWPVRQSHQGNAKVSPRKHNNALSVASKAQTSKTSISENALSLTTEAHIESNQGVGDLGTRLSESGGERICEPYPELPEFLKRNQ
jgi:hypothetical protein